MYQFFKTVFLTNLLLLLTACSAVEKFTWQKVSDDYSAVWAEDASEIAVMRLSYEEKQGNPLNGTSNKRKFQHQFFSQKINGQARQPITALRPYQAGQFFYMKQAHYLLVESLLEDTKSYFEKIDLNTGKTHRVLDIPSISQQGCNTTITAPPKAGVPFKTPSALAYSAIPSPTGKYIVTGLSSVCGQADIKIYLAENLTLVQQYSLKIPEAVTLIWFNDQHLVLTGIKKAWKITPSNSIIVQTSVPNCTNPKTSSSEITSNHQLLLKKEKGFTSVHRPSTTAFGCR
jgi:hypothetical protein